MTARGLLSFALWLAPLAAAASPVTLDDHAQTHALVAHLEALLDPSGSLALGDLDDEDLRPIDALDPGPGTWPGGRQPVVWLRFRVQVPADAQGLDWYFVLGRPLQPGTVWIRHASGRTRTIPVRLDPTGTSWRAKLPAEPGIHTVVLRIPGPLVQPSLLHVATVEGQERLMQSLHTGQGLYLGVMLTMLLVSVLMAVLIRDRAHRWYVGFLASSVATFALITGTASRFLFPTTPVGTLFRPYMAGLALVVLTGIQFSRLFLDTARVAPRLDRVARTYLAVAASVLVGVWALPDLVALRAVALLGLLVPFVALSAGLAALRAGSRWARFYLAGWSLFTVAGFLFALPITIPFLDARSFFQLSSATEAALFSLALVDRMRILRSERHRTEQALARAERTLARSEKLASLGQLVAGVAHEVSNPNNFLTFNLPILRDYVEAMRPHVEAAGRGDPGLRIYGLTVDEFLADATALIGNMEHGTERIAGIVSELRSYVRKDDAAQWVESDLNRVVDAAATLVRPQLQRQVKNFQVDLAPDLPPVRMIPGRLEQVVVNLLLNAGHAVATTPQSRVAVRTRREGGAVLVTVEDDGPGVPAEIREHIFEPFFTTKPGEQGTGMGLAISQKIVDEHGGTIELGDAAGPGACFTVRIPLGQDPP